MSGQTGISGTDMSGSGVAHNSEGASTRARSSAPPPSGINGRSKPTVPESDTLAKLPLFRGLTTEQLSKVSTLLQCKRCPAGTEIITVDQPGEIAYIILDGSVKIHIDQADGSDVLLAILGAGEIVGEMSLADSLGRSATVATLEPSTLLLIDRATFWANSDPGISVSEIPVCPLTARLLPVRLRARLRD